MGPGPHQRGERDDPKLRRRVHRPGPDTGAHRRDARAGPCPPRKRRPGPPPADGALVYEAESLQETRSATASLRAQGNCCGITWSGDAQLLFRSTKAGDTFTVGGRSFTVPDGGSYDFSAFLTRAPDYGTYQLAIDGREVGAPFDAYNPTAERVGPVGFGAVRLQKGTHTLTLTVVGKNPTATNYYAGLDVFRFDR